MNCTSFACSSGDGETRLASDIRDSGRVERRAEVRIAHESQVRPRQELRPVEKGRLGVGGVTKPLTSAEQKIIECESVCDCTSTTPDAWSALSSGQVTKGGPAAGRSLSEASGRQDGASTMRSGMA